MIFIKRLIRNNKGSALTFVLLVLIVVSVLGLAITGLAVSAFRMTRIDSDSESAYYIAEAGINHTIDFINTKVNDLYNTTHSADEFFSNLESYIDIPLTIDNFENNFGRTPEAVVRITGSRGIGENSADYTLRSEGRIGSSTRTVNSLITVNWIENEETARLEDIFLYGSRLKFVGNSIKGEGGTVVFEKIDLESNPSIEVTNLYLNGPVTMDHSSGDFGSKKEPGNIYVNGDFKLLSGAVRDIYGEVYVNGNFKLVGARIHGNVYVKGNLELGWTPQIHKNIYYTGKLKAPESYSKDLLNKCIKIDDVPSFEIPSLDFNLKEDSWYTANGYTIRGNVSEKNISNNTKLLVNSFYSDSSQSPSGNTIIVSKGDIVIRGWRHITGVLIAPNGSVTIEGGSFTGVILSNEGLITERGGWNLNMRIISDFFTEDTLPITVSGNGDKDTGTEEDNMNEQNRVVIKSPIKEE